MAAGDIHADPSAGAGIAPQTGIGVWTYGSWTVLDASLPTDIAVTGIVCNFPESNTNATVREIQVELGIGASGSEVMKVQIPWTIERITAAEYLMPPSITLTLPEPYSIPAGTRVSARVIHSGIPSSTAQTYDGFHLIYEEVVSGASVSSSDSGADSEASTLVVAISDINGNGTITEATSISLVATDVNGAITETGIVTVPVAGSDVGGGSETAALSFILADTAGDSESTSLSAQLSSADSGSDAEDPNIRQIASDANGTTAEGGIISVPISGTDAGSESETASLSASATAADANGVVSESADLVAAIPTTDAGTDTEATTLKAVLSSSDSNGSPVEASLVTTPVAGGNDPGTTVETASVRVFINGSDSGTISEISNNVVSITAADAGSETEVTTVIYKIAGTDAGTATEVGAIALGATDSATGVDNVSALRVASPDGGSGGDSSSVTSIHIFGADSGTALETSTLDTGAIIFAGSEAGRMAVGETGSTERLASGDVGDPSVGSVRKHGSSPGKMSPSSAGRIK